MIHETLETFGYPDTLIKDYKHWSVVLRSKQATLGALVLISKSPDTAYSALPEEAFAEKYEIIRDIESALQSAFSYDKINYLMLMMVDPQVHYHVIPRYSEARDFEGQAYTDPGWPKVPDLAHGPVLEGDELISLRNYIREHIKNRTADAA